MRHHDACQVGEILHCDLAGKFRTRSLNGASYFLLIKDECTGFRGVYFLKTKEEAPDRLMEFIPMMERQTGNYVKMLVSDNGTEFTNIRLARFLSEKGILHKKSAPYCPESNGRIEREIRTIKESAKTMMQ